MGYDGSNYLRLGYVSLKINIYYTVVSSQYITMKINNISYIRYKKSQQLIKY